MPNNVAVITYERQGRVFEIALTAVSMAFFESAAQQPHIRESQEESLVQALLAYKKGAILKVERRCDGRLNDGPNGEDSIQHFNSKGVLICAQRYKDNLLTDAADGTPAMRRFGDNGLLLSEMRYRDGRLSDSEDGKAAARYFDSKGQPYREAHYRAGKFLSDRDLSAQQEKVSAARVEAAFSSKLKLKTAP